MTEENTKTVHEVTATAHSTAGAGDLNYETAVPQDQSTGVPLNQPDQNDDSSGTDASNNASEVLDNEPPEPPSTPTVTKSASDSSKTGRDNGSVHTLLKKKSKARRAPQAPNREKQTGLHVKGGKFSITNSIPTMAFPPGSVRLGGVPLTHKEALEKYSESTTSTSTSVPVPVSARGADGGNSNRSRIQEAHMFRNMKGMVIHGGEFSINSGYGSGSVANLNAYTHPVGGGGGCGTPGPDPGSWAAHSINDVSRMTQTINKYVDLHLNTRKNRNKKSAGACSGLGRAGGSRSDAGNSNDARDGGPRPNVHTGRNGLPSHIQEMGILRGCDLDDFTITNAKFFVNGREV